MVFRIIGLVWALLAIMVFMDYAEDLRNVSWWRSLLCQLILIAGAPIFTINNILCFILDIFMPDGWNDDE